VFGPRRDRATGFIDRLLNITETMALADAFAGLAFLDARPDVDARRVAIIGFSYGGMSSVFAAYGQVADAFAGVGPRFAAHVAFYGPCIARLDDPATTGAPVLMLWGGRDQIVDAARCEEIAADLEKGGSPTRLVAYPDALHRWDGGRRQPWRASRHIADCRLRVRADNVVIDQRTFLHMSGPTSRKLILGLCSSSEGYLIGGDAAIRRQSNAELARFLNPILFEGAEF
jgi:dienelactone hydrolase